MARKRKLTDSPFIKGLFYGNPGGTKTRTVCTACMDGRMAPVLYLNASGNPESISDYPVHPDIVDMEKLSDFNEPYDWIKSGQKPEHKFARDFDLKPPYKTLIIDQLTDVQQMSFQVVLGAQNVGPGDIPKKREWEHYNKVLYQMDNFVKFYTSLDMHVLMTALERVERDDSVGTITQYTPMLEGQSSRKVPGYCLLVCRLIHRSQLATKMRIALDKGSEGFTSVGLFAPIDKAIAKNQYGGTLGDYLTDPTMTDILNGIEGKGGE